jgi:hypothetical protein
MFIPEISASNVAGLIGLHNYKSKEEVMYSLLCKNKLTKELVKDIESKTNRRPFDQICKDVLKDSSIAQCIRQGIAKAQETQDVQAVLNDVKSKASIIVQLRYTQYAKDVQERLVQEVSGVVSKQRGLKNENTILDNYEVDREVKVTERNTKNCQKAFPTFKLTGRIDGYVESENRIVDSKDRTRFWEQVPIYDEIQLRCYMNMLNAKESELIERFPDRTVRHTKFTNDEDKWKVIQTGIEQSVHEINEALKDHTLLKQIIFANTVSIL